MSSKKKTKDAKKKLKKKDPPKLKLKLVEAEPEEDEEEDEEPLFVALFCPAIPGEGWPVEPGEDGEPTARVVQAHEHGWAAFDEDKGPDPRYCYETEQCMTLIEMQTEQNGLCNWSFIPVEFDDDDDEESAKDDEDPAEDEDSAKEDEE